MGLLEDAIREHLDLKRRHGADPSEVARKEHEALGPRPAAPPSRGAGCAAGRARSVARGRRSPTDDDERPATPAADDARRSSADPSAVDARARRASRPPPSRGVDRPTTRPDVSTLRGRALRAASRPRGEPEAEAKADEDVLEETPEFLQETPEHDRLWFEQKPPRDFDFDR